jgi:FMN phosphatase YigB (HAD superfamily)
MSRALLLDFDGVVLRKHHAHDVVSMRCRKYVQKFVPIRNPVKANELNRHLYRTHGHTVLGLRKIGYDVEVNEFNNQVYSSIPYTQLFNKIQSTHVEDIKSVLKVLNYCKSNDIDVHLFSNAPDVWCLQILHAMGIDVEAYFEGSLSVITGTYLKPEKECYDAVKVILNKYDQICFVDDTLVNFQHVYHDQKWTNLLMSHDVQVEPIPITEKMAMIYNHGDISKFI